ncbi:MAG: hypothetical protein Q8Q65_03335 [bacterium]|nr:hypothetical protein [bacterium]
MNELDKLHLRSFDEVLEKARQPRWWVYEQWLNLRRFIINQIYYLEWLYKIVGFFHLGW